MPAFCRCAGCCLAVAWMAAATHAQNGMTIGWPPSEAQQRSVYNVPQGDPTSAHAAAPSNNPDIQPAVTSSPRYAQRVEPATYDSGFATSDGSPSPQEDASGADDPLANAAKQRRLLPRRGALDRPTSDDGRQSFATASGGLSPPFNSLSNVLTALAVVVGCFLLCIALVRRRMPRAAGTLPAEVASVLGRVPLAGRQFAYLLRLGNKLVLVSITPTGGAESLAEVTDPAEVGRLLGMCQHVGRLSVSAAFGQSYEPVTSHVPNHLAVAQEGSIPSRDRAAEFAHRQGGHRREV